MAAYAWAPCRGTVAGACRIQAVGQGRACTARLDGQGLGAAEAQAAVMRVVAWASRHRRHHRQGDASLKDDHPRLLASPRVLGWRRRERCACR